MPSRHPRYMHFNTNTFKTSQVYAVQHPYLQDTPGIYSSTLIPSRHPRYIVQPPNLYFKIAIPTLFSFFFKKKIREHDVSINYVD